LRGSNPILDNIGLVQHNGKHMPLEARKCDEITQ